MSRAAFTATTVAGLVGVSQVTLRTWELGQSRPSPRHARRLAQVLGVDVDELEIPAREGEEEGPR